MTATVQCVVCDCFTLRESAKYAAQGLGRCTVMTDRPDSFVSPKYPRQCRNHQRTPAAKAEARIEWLRQLRSEEATC
ncbi:hypothetical protein D3C87_2154460 [compost metagenome]